MVFIKTCEYCVHNCYDLPQLKRKLAFDALWWSLWESFSMLWNYWLKKSAMFVCHQKVCLTWPGKFPFKKTKNTFFVCMFLLNFLFVSWQFSSLWVFAFRKTAGNPALHRSDDAGVSWRRGKYETKINFCDILNVRKCCMCIVCTKRVWCEYQTCMVRVPKKKNLEKKVNITHVSGKEGVFQSLFKNRSKFGHWSR